MSLTTLLVTGATILSAALTHPPTKQPSPDPDNPQATTQPASQPRPTSQPATLADFAWLEGRWTGEMPAGRMEEVFSAPDGGLIIGMFRLVNPEGETLVLELIALEEVGGTVMNRFRHFNSQLEPWEPPKQTPTLYLVEESASRCVWQNADLNNTLRTSPFRVTWERDGDDRLRFQVEVERDGAVQKIMEAEVRRQRP